MLPKPPQTLKRRSRSPTKATEIQPSDLKAESKYLGNVDPNLFVDGRSSCPPDIYHIDHEQSLSMSCKHLSGDNIVTNENIMPADESGMSTFNTNPFLDSQFNVDEKFIPPSSNPFLDDSFGIDYSTVTSENPFLYKPSNGFSYTKPVVIVNYGAENDMTGNCVDKQSPFCNGPMEKSETIELSETVFRLSLSLHNAHVKIDELTSRIRDLEERVNQKL